MGLFQDFFFASSPCPRSLAGWTTDGPLMDKRWTAPATRNQDQDRRRHVKGMIGQRRPETRGVCYVTHTAQQRQSPTTTTTNLQEMCECWTLIELDHTCQGKVCSRFLAGVNGGHSTLVQGGLSLREHTPQLRAWTPPRCFPMSAACSHCRRSVLHAHLAPASALMSLDVADHAGGRTEGCVFG